MKKHNYVYRHATSKSQRTARKVSDEAKAFLEEDNGFNNLLFDSKEEKEESGDDENSEDEGDGD